MNSMTGFGKSEQTKDGHKLRIEVKSVNHRFLDISIRSPRFMMYLEENIRSLIKKKLNRGRVDVFVTYSAEASVTKTMKVDFSLMDSYVRASNEIAEKFDMKNDVTVSQLMRLPDAITFEDNEEDTVIKELLATNLEAALDELIMARANEGENLAQDIIKRLNTIQEKALEIKARGYVVLDEYRLKLQDRISELLSGTPIDEQRLAQEIAYMADRCNVTEELVRIKSHVGQFIESTKNKGALGRNMDFIVQELNREFNTIGSKSQDSAILQTVITCKGEVEKIREQIQNIE